MKVSLIAAKAKNGVIGCGPDIPWSAKGEQLLFKALTYNQWLLGHCCKVSDEAAFCLIQRPYISKTLLTRRISPRGS
ncbi:hypothetical protein ACU8PF_004828, partial [Salmonella enterica subsp. enterica serovar Infantis]